VVKPTATRADVEQLYRRHAGEIRGYLYRRAGQAGADLLLAAHREARHRQDAETERARVHESSAAREDGGRASAVRAALDDLREPDRELIRLTEWERLSTAEAAVVLGLRPGTARVRLHRARRALAGHPALADLSDVGSLSRDG
jgi:RNA polymerase sigma-70 factor (ECF subfamily)